VREASSQRCKGAAGERRLAAQGAAGEIAARAERPRRSLVDAAAGPRAALALASIQSALDMLLQGTPRTIPPAGRNAQSLARAGREHAGTGQRLFAPRRVQHSEMERRVRQVQLLDVLSAWLRKSASAPGGGRFDFAVDVPASLSVVNGTPEDMEHLLST